MHNASTLGSTIALDSAHIMPRAKANTLENTAHSGIQAVGKIAPLPPKQPLPARCSVAYTGAL